MVVPEQLANNGWTADKWDQLENQARETVNRHAHLRQVIPRAPDMPGAYIVPTLTQPARGGSPISIEITSAAPPTPQEVPFSLGAQQSADLDIAMRLVERAARTLAFFEEKDLYSGLSGSGSAVGIDVVSGEPLSAAVVRLVVNGVNELNANGTPYTGPYCLAAEPAFFSAIAVPSPGHPRGAFPILETLLGEGSRILHVPLQNNEGQGRAILFSMDPFAMDLVFVEAPTIALLGLNNGAMNLQLQERYRLRIIDKAAIRTLQLKSK